MWAVRRKVATSNISLHVRHQEDTKSLQLPIRTRNKARNIRACIPEVTTRHCEAKWGIVTAAFRLSSAFWHATANPFKVLTYSKNDDVPRKDINSKAEINSLHSPKISHPKDKTCPWNGGYERRMPWFGGTTKRAHPRGMELLLNSLRSLIKYM